MKSNQIILKISLIFALLFSYTAISQDMLNASELNKEWNLLKEQDGIKLYVQQQKCHVEPMEKPLSFVFVKIVNETGVSKDVYFQIGLQYDQECAGCDDQPESQRVIKVGATSSVECDNTFNNPELSLLITNENFSDQRVFEALKLIDLNVE